MGKELLITNGRESQVVLYWFQTDSGILTDEYSLKLDMMKNALLGRSQRSTFIRFSTRIESEHDRAAAMDDLAGFVERIAPHIDDALTGKDSRFET